MLSDLVCCSGDDSKFHPNRSEGAQMSAINDTPEAACWSGKSDTLAGPYGYFSCPALFQSIMLTSFQGFLLSWNSNWPSLLIINWAAG